MGDIPLLNSIASCSNTRRIAAAATTGSSLPQLPTREGSAAGAEVARGLPPPSGDWPADAEDAVGVVTARAALCSAGGTAAAAAGARVPTAAECDDAAGVAEGGRWRGEGGGDDTSIGEDADEVSVDADDEARGCVRTREDLCPVGASDAGAAIAV